MFLNKREKLIQDLKKISEEFEKITNKVRNNITRDFYRLQSEYGETYRQFWKTFKEFKNECFFQSNNSELYGIIDDIEKNDNFKSLSTEIVGPNLNIVSKSSNIRTLNQLLLYCKVDLDKYEVIKHTINSWGSEKNENFQVKAWLKEKISSIDSKQEYKELLNDARDYMPKYNSINYKLSNRNNGDLLEISLFDHHFGQLSWGDETGYENYDIKIANKIAIEAFQHILNKSKNYEISKILLPIGNDFFNVNNADATTVKGTLRPEDERWKKTFKNGRKLWVSLIEMCLQVSPVDVLIIPGNHDEERVYYLGDSLECWFNKCENVNINNSPKNRKYYQWGKNLIMFTHGSEESKINLINLMPVEEPIKWSQSKYREIHKGHLHYAKQTAFQMLDEVQGVRDWILPSLVSLDDWHSGKGYSALRETISMIWNKEKGKEEMIFYHP